VDGEYCAPKTFMISVIHHIKVYPKASKFTTSTNSPKMYSSLSLGDLVSPSSESICGVLQPQHSIMLLNWCCKGLVPSVISKWVINISALFFSEHGKNAAEMHE
jgi:hypothetical protein